MPFYHFIHLFSWYSFICSKYNPGQMTTWLVRDCCVVGKLVTFSLSYHTANFTNNDFFLIAERTFYSQGHNGAAKGSNLNCWWEDLLSFYHNVLRWNIWRWFCILNTFYICYISSYGHVDILTVIWTTWWENTKNSSSLPGSYTAVILYV